MPQFASFYVWFPCAVATLVAVWVSLPRKRHTARRLPPGPGRWPLVGNALVLPSQYVWLAYDEWFKTYGDLISLNVLGQDIILLGSMKHIKEIMEKRSRIYSDRAYLPVVNEMLRWDFSVGFMPYGQRWRSHRKLLHQYFHPNAVAQYRPIHVEETRKFLVRLLDSPENFQTHVRHLFAANIMKITYDIDISGVDDIYVSTAEECLKSLEMANVPGVFLMDKISWLRKIPLWLPGAGFHRKAARWAQLNRQLITKPFEVVKKAMVTGTAGPSVARDMIQTLPSGDSRAEAEEIAMNSAGVAYAGGADTTISTVLTFFLAMATNPEAQAKAQEELDAVVGTHRLPTHDDHSSLPYIQAVILEALRWQNVTPVALPHVPTEDDEYEGYFIPKGTMVVGCTWTILHDPTIYPDPHRFNPDRFLKDGKINPDVLDPRVVAFGYGRRVCPGKYLSLDSLFSIVASLLAIFNITAPVDAQGNLVPLEARMTGGLVSYPLPFECTIKPRSLEAASLIRQGE